MMMTHQNNKPQDINMYQIKLPFPWKLHRLLEDVEKDGNAHIVSWLPDGKGFKVHKPREFRENIMKAYFNQTRFKSFIRQVSHF
jgi:hypothetical protein